MSDFKPSQVLLIVPPLVGTMKKAEVESAAAVIVRACQVRGDTWQRIEFDDLVAVVKDDVENKREPLSSLMHNPFFRPSFAALSDGSYGRWVDTGKDKHALELTAAGIAAIAKWVST